MTKITDRTVDTVRAAFRTLEGDGFEVLRALPARQLEAVGPFIFLDQFGPIEVRPGEAKGAPAHPHAGIETLTLLLEGRSEHKDSLGNASAMRPGEVQWMRAGRGVVHDEGPDDVMRREGGRVHGVQLWLNMPRGSKHTDPAYRHVRADEIPVLTAGNARTRVIAGTVDDVTGPIETTGAPLVAQVSFTAAGSVGLRIPAATELAVYVMTGSTEIGDARALVHAGSLATLTAGTTVHLTVSAAAELLLIGGDPLDAPIVRHGPFVMNTATELQQAVLDFHAGRMGRIAA